MAHDHLAYSDLSNDRQQRAYHLGREHHVLAVYRMDRRNSALSDALRPVPKFAVGDWVWVYNTAATIRQGAKTDTDAKVLKTKLSLNWTGPYKVLGVGPCTPADTPYGSSLSANILHLDPPSHMPGADARRAFRCNAASPVPTPTIMATCQSICQRG